MSQPATAAAPTNTSSRATRVVGALTLVGIAALALLGLVVTPPEVVQGETVRLIYIHPAVATAAYVAFGGTALGSAMYLWKRSEFWDLFAGASAEVGVLFTALTLVTGSLWGRPTWGVYWVWDARLTTTALLMVLFLGYLAIRRIPGDPAVRSKRAAIAGLVAFVDVPLVHYSVEWWRTLHQGPTIARLDPQIDGIMLFTMMLGFVVFLLLYWWLMLHRFRVEWLQARVERESLDDALARRRAEGGPPPGDGRAAPDDRPLVPAGEA